MQILVATYYNYLLAEHLFRYIYILPKYSIYSNHFLDIYQ